MWDKASDFSDWWDEQHELSKEALEEFLEEHPDLVGIAVHGAFNTAMDIAEPSVDMWRFGAGAAEGPQGLVKDGFRFVGLMGPVGAVGKGASFVEGAIVDAKIAKNFRLSEAIADIPKDHLTPIGKPPGSQDGLCWAVTSTKALVQTGQRVGSKLYVSVKDFAREIGHPYDPIKRDSLDTVRPNMEEWIGILRKIGAEVSDIKQVKSFEELAEITPNEREGVALVEILGSNDKREALRHVVHAFRDVSGKIRIVDRSGRIVSSLKELGDTIDAWRVESAAILKNVVVKQIGKAFDKAMDIAYPTGVLAMAAEAATGFSRKANETIAQAFEIFKRVRRGDLSGTGARHVVGPNETVQDIARAHYNDESKWPLILEANRNKLTRSGKLIAASQRLIIPELPHIPQFSRLGEQMKPSPVPSLDTSQPVPSLPFNQSERQVLLKGTVVKGPADTEPARPPSDDPDRPSGVPAPLAIERVDDIPFRVLRRVSEDIDRSLDLLPPTLDSREIARRLEAQLNEIGDAAVRAGESPEGRSLVAQVSAIKTRHQSTFWSSKEDPIFGEQTGTASARRQPGDAAIGDTQDDDARNRRPIETKPRPDAELKDSPSDAAHLRRDNEQAERDESVRRERVEQAQVQTETAQRLQREQEMAEQWRRDGEARARIEAIRAELEGLDRKKAEEKKRDAIAQRELEKSRADERAQQIAESERGARERDAQRRDELERESVNLEADRRLRADVAAKARADADAEAKERAELADERAQQFAESERMARERDTQRRDELERESARLEADRRLRADAAAKARADADAEAKERAKLADEARAELITTAKLYLADQQMSSAREGAATETRDRVSRSGVDTGASGYGRDKLDPRGQPASRDHLDTKVGEELRRRADDAAAKQLEQEHDRLKIADEQEKQERWRQDQAKLADTLDQLRRRQDQIEAGQREDDRKRWQSQIDRENEFKRSEQLEAWQRRDDCKRLDELQARRHDDDRPLEAEARQRGEERQRREVEEARQRDEERQRREAEEARQRDEERQRRAAEEARQRDEERQRRDAEEARLREEERQRREVEEARQRDEERQRREAEEARLREEDRRRAEENQRRREEDERRKREEDERRNREEDERRKNSGDDPATTSVSVKIRLPGSDWKSVN